jgi:site-specific recombinase XerD
MANNLGKGKTKINGKSSTRVIGKGNFVTLRARTGKKGESLYLDCNVNGRRRYEFLDLLLVKARTPLEKQSNKEQLMTAEQVRAKRDIELSSNQHGLIPSHKRKTNFIEWFTQRKDKRIGTNKALWNCVGILLKEFNNDSDFLPFSAVTVEWLEEWKTFLLEKLDSANSAHTYYSRVACAIKEGAKEGIISYDPTIRVDNIDSEDRIMCYHTIDEVRALSKSDCKIDEIKRAYLFICLTSLRSCDTFALTWRKIQVSSLDDGKKEYRVMFTQKKVKDAEYLPISEEAYKLLGQPKTTDPDELIFSLKYSRYLTLQLRSWVNDSGINKKVGWHTGRHTNAVLMLMNGVDIYTVSKRMGHSSISVTEKYLQIVDKKMSEAADAIKLNIGS